MRFTRTVILGLLSSSIMISLAYADNQAPRIFGSTNCQQKFACSAMASTDLASLASDCSVLGLGIAAQPGLFEGATLDSSSCMAGNIPSSGNSGHTSAVQCCVIANQDTCSIRCQLLMY